MPARPLTLAPVRPIKLRVALLDADSGVGIEPPGMGYVHAFGSAIQGDLEPGGTLVFRRLPPGLHELVPVVPGRASFPVELDLPPGGPGRPFEIRVPRAAEVWGHVRDGAGQPISGVDVLAGNGVFGGEREAITAADGGFRLTGMAGEYTVAFRKATFATRTLRKVTVHGTAPVRLDVTLSPGATVCGVVRSQQGRPVPGVLVRAGEEKIVDVPATVTDDEGAYALANVPAGACVLSAAATTRAVVVEDGASMREDFAIEYP